METTATKTFKVIDCTTHEVIAGGLDWGTACNVARIYRLFSETNLNPNIREDDCENF